MRCVAGSGDCMHDIEVRPHIVERVLARRGRYHIFDALDPRSSVFVVIDMINMFLAPGAPAEVPASRGIVDNINRLNNSLRKLGCKIIWINSPVMSDGVNS